MDLGFRVEPLILVSCFFLGGVVGGGGAGIFW